MHAQTKYFTIKSLPKAVTIFSRNTFTRTLGKNMKIMEISS